MVNNMLNIVVLNNDETFLRVLDPELCTLTETHEKGGVRTLDFEYIFQDLHEDKELFKAGNKIWVNGDVNIKDCLYVINTNVENSIYDGNYFKFEVEEALIELNYTPICHQNELTSDNGLDINYQLTNTGVVVELNYNSLNFWFGDWFNIGIVQKCLNNTCQKFTFTGAMTRMSLLRAIEESSGNVFITRYEKDLKTNTIHRYLDFLNPSNPNKAWQCYIDLDFYDDEYIDGAYDDDGNIVPEGNLDAEDEDDITTFPLPQLQGKLDITNAVFQITDSDYNVLTLDDTELSWTSSEIGLLTEDPQTIQLTHDKDGFGIETLTKSFIVSDSQVPGGINPGFITISDDPDYADTSSIPDDSYFVILENGKPVFRTVLNTRIGAVHTDILDFGFNLENVIYDVDESDTYKAVSPVIEGNSSIGNTNQLTRGDISNLITDWLDLSVSKGHVIPMIVEKVNIKAKATATKSAYEVAVASLGEYDLESNYWTRPLKPNDNLDSDEKTYEFLKATAYWRAPYDKTAGDFHVSTNKSVSTSYNTVSDRPDNGDPREVTNPKMGTTTTSDENKYQIFNQVCQDLREHELPKINIDVDVANLQRKGSFNNYELYDKVYIKIEDNSELISARVTKTTREAHDIAKNTIEIDNYSINPVQKIPDTVYIDADNPQEVTYPASTSLSCQLINTDYDEKDKASVQYPANQLLTFNVYEVSNNNSTFTGTTYTKLTSINGECTIPIKLNPGQYEIEIYYPGDDEYSDASTTVQCSIGGTLEVATTSSNKKKNKSKTSKTKTKKVTTYWTKCGLSPDKKHKEIISIAKPSGPDARNYAYRWYRTVFKNYCPFCKKWGTLRFDGGKKTKCISSQKDGLGYKPSVQHEKEITCIKCDSDFCGVTGAEKWNPIRGRLKKIKQPVKVSETELHKLTSGKLKYGTKTVKVKKKKVTSKKTRSGSNCIPASVRKWALSKVGDSKGWAACKKLAKEAGKWKYLDYPNFRHKPAFVIKNGGNCCDQARALAYAMDAAGCLDYVNIWYVHIHNDSTSKGHVFLKVQHKKTKKWVYVDPTQKYHPWNHCLHGGKWGQLPGTTHKYSNCNTPF